MTSQSGNERELELVNRYVEEHFDPIRKLLGHKIPDPEVRAIAIRRCTRHIFHWQQHPDEDEPVQPSQQSDGSNAQSREAAYEAAKDKAPEDWSTGAEPATPKQLAVLRDRGVPHGAGVTKAEASKLISQHVYKGARA